MMAITTRSSINVNALALIRISFLVPEQSEEVYR